MIDSLIHSDQQIFLYLNNLGSTEWDTFWLFITNKWASIPLYLGLLIMLYRFLTIKELLVIVFSVVFLILCTDQTANVFKDNFQRLRPCNLPYEDRSITNCGKFGFFSAHAASSMALAIFVGFLLKPYNKFILPGLIIWSLVIGYSRIYVGVHYPGDVLVGLSFGTIYGLLFFYLNKWISYNYLFSQALVKSK